ncbi:hypothetical protein A3860_09050 [Niastella vici]|uniref:Vitamin K epoxide reductase domain-containing protein n=1 Tax=Niastella vici TaxID=1703345 RepID=A0A1V9FHB8_9BACT|nr:vitamin K epoxide reductase family protein [Niastella vici]OQP57763.1 hypothetical protein A3860_09050 [Niastella vici]
MFNIIYKLFEPKTNCFESAKLFADLLRVKITNASLTKDIEEHPDYPSLLSISDVLNSYGISNISASFDKNSFFEVPTPFITNLRGIKRPVNYFAVVSSINNGAVRYYDHENARWETCGADDFYERSSGVILMAEVEEGAGEIDYNKKIRQENNKQFFLAAISICLPLVFLVYGVFSFAQQGMNALLPFSMSILTLAGAVVGVLLLLFELDQYTPVLQKICRPTNKINCGAVLNSRGAKIAGISWATLGFTYFSAQILLLLFWGITNPRALFVISWLNAMAAPYILFSVFYQWRVIKQWCVLCLSVQFILLLQLVTSIIAEWHTAIPVDEALSAYILLPVVVAILVPFVSVSLLEPAYRSAKQSKSNKLQLQRLKHSPKIFETLLVRERSIDRSVEGMGLLLGNRNATTRIVKVCNPYCKPCSESHKIIDGLLANNPDLQVQIIFFTANEEDDIRKPVARHLMAIAEKGDETITREALDNWYMRNIKDYEMFEKMYPLNGEIQDQVSKVERMQHWCMENRIDFTPTFFVNGYQLPKMYNVTDLKYFLSV